jgi:biotin transport system permease protein
MRELHVAGDSFMHRRSARLKLLALALLGICLFLTEDLVLLSLTTVVSGLLYFTVGLPFAEAARRLRPALLTVVVVAAFSLLFNPAHLAAVTVLRLSTLFLFAAAVTATTTVATFIEEITLLAMPLEKAGLVRAADIGLAVGLVIRFAPEVLMRYRAIREAHQARGLKIRISTTLVPLIILTLRDADAIAAAIDARGIRRH